MMTDKVAVVTGANKGIGLSIVRELCKRGVGVVYLTSRDVSRGLQAIEKLKSEGFNPEYHQLDVVDNNSVKALADNLRIKHGGIDILINNAGIAINGFDYEECKRVFEVNYRSQFILEKHIFPLLKDNARVIQITSSCGHISNLKNNYWIEKLTSDYRTVKDINDFVNWFLDSVKNNKINLNDFAEDNIVAYRMSKVAVCSLVGIQQKKLSRGISVNHMHPGIISTDMTGVVIDDIPLQDAGKTPAYLALDIDQSVKGKYFWFDGAEKDWSNPKEELYFKMFSFLPK